MRQKIFSLNYRKIKQSIIVRWLLFAAILLGVFGLGSVKNHAAYADTYPDLLTDDFLSPQLDTSIWSIDQNSSNASYDIDATYPGVITLTSGNTIGGGIWLITPQLFVPSDYSSLTFEIRAKWDLHFVNIGLRQWDSGFIMFGTSRLTDDFGLGYVEDAQGTIEGTLIYEGDDPTFSESDWHVYKIVLTEDQAFFYIDGDLKANPQSNLPHDIPLFIYISQGTRDDGQSQNLSVDYVHLVANTAPTVDAGPDQTVNEGDTITLTATGSDFDGDPLTYAWDLDDDGSFETPGQSVSFTAVNGAATVDVQVQVSDGQGGSDTDTATITVNNVAPEVGFITPSTSLTPILTEVQATAVFTDPGVLDTHTAVWDWGDGTVSAGTVTEADGSGTAAGSHTYLTPGVYVVNLMVTDDDGDSDEASYQYVVVYDPNGGYVTGVGTIDSPLGSYVPDPSLTGTANFGFVSRYEPGASEPTGKTQFVFQAAGMDFRSFDYDWLVVAGARAMFKGTGTINGGGDYSFMLTAIDGERPGGGGYDKFRIKIWDTATEEIIYDNQLGDDDNGPVNTIISSGKIKIHN